MPINILMPALSPTMTEGKLASWGKKEGETVEAGDVLCEIETDKATMEVEAVDEGILGKIVVPAGTDNVAVNAVIALLLEEGEDASALDNAPLEAAPAPAAAAPVETPTAGSAPAAPVTASGERLFASPLARRIAAQESLDLAAIPGSGPHGRIIKKDIEKALAEGTGMAAPAAAAKPAVAASAAPAAVATVDDPIFALMPEFEAVANSNMRKTIANRLTDSARDVPHFNLTVDVEIDKLLGLRQELNSRDGADYKLSVNDFVVKATALALTRQPDCNVAYTDDAILKFKQVDMCIAVSVDGGLITPIIKNAAAKGLSTLSAEAKELAGKARDGKLQPEEYQGGTFTISNMGMFGVKGFNSIINPPQGGILSVGAGEQRPVVKDGALGIATVMTLTLAVDHRCIDGATAAAFVKELKGLIEDPIALML
ncbi:pyruvate dehydrogenase complex dihydrolipoamide acetyltransferase [Magnetospira sp. QH-2]|uniref:pyruvate dehydrogenase complex dihydrolipoamide acetyltransferase n=1 Tax=Magnetospira sp. (strain QH-2) TaxID=1288970 RepID=UPI0003E80A6B|nr:pyruvate dehydrogenase complex dihydrolipoamide acetyltransferase [Magnetospira sp. QH-2]CCQ73942.1 Dihydrolipoyllysine-residue acetyltransferase component of pyruvate dehydrogenase complex (E2) (Dihydrolipoamide acetyltransferase component of pyruvate dehydrogenase complex) [Magnetospira sp. QH-2]